MAGSLAAKLDTGQRKMLAMRGEVSRKPLAEADQARLVGQLIERGLELARITKQQAAADMGYRDQSALSRWISAVENPRFDKLISLPGFAEGFTEALGEHYGRVTVILERRRA